MIIIGQGNRGENGRGYLAAYTADTGKLIWRFLVVPDPGDPGSETWADKRTIPTGGGAIWTEPSYDPETNLIYVGTANPVHMFDPQGRPGDNLYTNSIIALDVDTGKLKWYFQTMPNESWDYDSVAITQLYDATIGGEMRKVISQTNRNGFFYTLDRTNGQFIQGKPFTTVNWTAGLDPKTGKPLDYDATKTVQDYAGLAVRYGKKAIDVRPAHYGMPTLMPNTYDPTRGITYFNAMIGEANYFNSRAADPEKQLIGTGFREIFCGSHTKDNAVEPIVRSVRNPNCKVSHGLLGGIDVHTGNTVKKLEVLLPRLFRRARHRRRPALHGRHHGQDIGHRQGHHEGAVELRHRDGLRRGADDLFGERQAVHRADARRPARPRRRLVPGGGGARAERDPDGVRPLWVKALA